MAWLLGIFVVCLAAVFLMFSNLVSSYKESVATESATHLAEVTRQVRMYMEESMRSDSSLVHSLALDIASSRVMSAEELLEFMHSHKQFWNINHIYVYNSNGVCIDENGRQVRNQLSIKDIFETVSGGKSLQINDTQIEYSTIVKSGLQLQGSPIVAVSVVRYLNSMIDRMGFSSFGGAGWIYLTHQNGVKISQTNVSSAPNVYNPVALFKPEKLVNLTNPGVTLEKAMKNASEQVFRYSEGQPRYVVLTPVRAPGETWFIFYVVPENVVDASVDKFLNRVGLLTLSVAALMLILFMLFALVYVERSRRYGEALKMRDRFVELLTSETDNVFFLVSAQQAEPLYISANAASVLGSGKLTVSGHQKGFRFAAAAGEKENDTLRGINQELEKWDGCSPFVSGYVPCEIKGAQNYLVAHIYPVEGREGEYLGLVQNVTRERQRETDLRNALTMADSANKAKTQFLASMSHDIRTPLNAIVGMSRFAEKSLDDRDKLLRYIKIIQGSSEHLLQLINDVLDMSRIESGKLRFAEDSFDLKESLDSVYDIIAPLCAAKKQHLIFDRDEVKTGRVKGDSLKLNQILINLLNNAVKFTHEGGNVSFSARELQSIKPGISSYKFTVHDDGIGIPPDKLEQIFEPFTRMDDATVRSIEGTGLGLAITKSFVEAMGGKIMVRSEVGRGSEFSVEVSFLADKEQEQQKSAESRPDGEADFSGRRALLAEDNEINRYIASTILKGWGFAVDEACDGAKAIGKFKASAIGYYDIIFMDIQMPVMNGYSAVASIRRLGRKDAAAVPIVAMTANVFAEDVEKARQAGMNAHVGKPIDPDALRKVTAKLLSGGEK